VLPAYAQVQLLQREAELAEATSSAEGSSKALKLEQARLQEAADQWRAKALELQAEVSSSMSSCVLPLLVVCTICS
jgi:hypothetical protein